MLVMKIIIVVLFYIGSYHLGSLVGLWLLIIIHAALFVSSPAISINVTFVLARMDPFLLVLHIYLFIMSYLPRSTPSVRSTVLPGAPALHAWQNKHKSAYIQL